MELFYKEDSFCALIVGQSGIGKTHFLLELLEKEYYAFFDEIIIFCPTFNNNKTYQSKEWVKKLDAINPEDRLNECLAVCREKYAKKSVEDDQKTLFIIDDCAAEKDSSTRNSELSKLAFTGRHDGISVIVLTQKYTSICKDFREQIRWVVLFTTKDKKSYQTCLEENDVIEDIEEAKKIKYKLKESPKMKLIMRTFPPYGHRLVW